MSIPKGIIWQPQVLCAMWRQETTHGPRQSIFGIRQGTLSLRLAQQPDTTTSTEQKQKRSTVQRKQATAGESPGGLPGGALPARPPGGAASSAPRCTLNNRVRLHQMDPVGAPKGIDPKTACRVEVIVNSYFTVKDGRKEYHRGTTGVTNT
uniref:Uncharacterized protein n=1 Tax=Oryza punctata TaxID=4537 RepID=A0A0E0JZA0_ORYPU